MNVKVDEAYFRLESLKYINESYKIISDSNIGFVGPLNIRTKLLRALENFIKESLWN